MAANLALWLLVVFFFSQGIGLWRLLVVGFGNGVAGALPIVFSALLAALTTGFVWRRRATLIWPWAVASGAVFVVGLISTDPAFPAKRVHVPEYFVLAVIVYWSCRNHMPRRLAVWGGVVLAAMLGGVDEIVQGAMTTRTYGLRDLGSNALGALSAGLFLEAVSGRYTSEEYGRVIVPRVAIGLLGYGLLLLGAHAHKGVGIPIWIYLPALATLPLLMIDRSVKGRRLLAAMGAVCAVAIVLAGGINALDIDFR